MDRRKWYYLDRAGTEHGPMSERTLLELFDDGTLVGSTRVRFEGMGTDGPLMAESIPFLAARLPARSNERLLDDAPGTSMKQSPAEVAPAWEATFLSRLGQRLQHARRRTKMGLLLILAAALLIFSGQASLPFLVLIVAAAVLGTAAVTISEALESFTELERCERCGQRGDTGPYSGNRSTGIVTFKAPLRLCSACRYAHDRYFEHHLLLAGPATVGLKPPLYKEFEKLYGPKTDFMLPLIALAGENPDYARRVVTDEDWSKNGDDIVRFGRALNAQRSGRTVTP